jgi:pimeloyl-ACP methyl ester carboxylesterase
MRRFSTSDGLSLAYSDEGDGPPLLCLPGLTRNSEDFTPVVADFGGAWRVIRLDPRGRGASDHDPDPTRYTVAVEARDALELLDHLGLARVPILGTSRGGLLALMIGAVAPERLAGVAFVDIGPVIEVDGLSRILDYLGRVPPYPDLDTAAVALEDACRGTFPGVPVAAWRAHAARIWRETPKGLALRYDPRLRDAFEATMRGGPLPDLWPYFDALPPVPLALLRGANSDLLSARTAAEMVARRPELALTVVADRGHVPFLDEPESRAAIAAFLEEVAP